MTYSVKLLFKISIIGKPQVSLVDSFYNDIEIFYEQSIIMLSANSFDEAYEKAEEFAKLQQDDYINKYGQRVEYRFFDYFDCFIVIEEVPLNLNNEIIECYSCYFYDDIDKNERYKDDCYAEKMLSQACADETHKLRRI